MADELPRRPFLARFRENWEIVLISGAMVGIFGQNFVYQQHSEAHATASQAAVTQSIVELQHKTDDLKGQLQEERARIIEELRRERRESSETPVACLDKGAACDGKDSPPCCSGFTCEACSPNSARKCVTRCQ